MYKAIFIDRDGVINKLPPKYPNDGIGDIRNYITKWEDFEFLPGVLEAFRLIKESEYIPIIISNQGGAIGRKLIGINKIRKIFRDMQSCIYEHTTRHIAFYFCPHLISDNCACRKPKPGMLYQAAIEHDIDLSKSWMIGDSESDIDAGKFAGIPAENRILIYDGEPPFSVSLCGRTPSLLEAIKLGPLFKTP